MKKMEVVMKSSAFDRFRESASRLGISEYDVSDVRISPSLVVKECRRLYRGQEYTLDFLPGVKVEFVAFDEDAREIAGNILTLVAPERIVIFPLDEVISMSTSSVHAAPRPSSERGAPEIATFAH